MKKNGESQLKAQKTKLKTSAKKIADGCSKGEQSHNENGCSKGEQSQNENKRCQAEKNEKKCCYVAKESQKGCAIKCSSNANTA